MADATIKQEVEVDVTPAQMAAVFWQWSCAEQAEFFAELGKITKDCQHNANMQWLWMSDAIKEREDKTAVECFLSFTAFAYDYWPQKTESQFLGAHQ